MSTDLRSKDGGITEYVTAMIGGQLFGLPISRVQDVFMPERLTRVPLAPGDVAGVLNLRGRIVTAIDMRARLGLRILWPLDRRHRRSAEARRR
jgi:purine-binding chemotaxis protein CheW